MNLHDAIGINLREEAVVGAGGREIDVGFEAGGKVEAGFHVKLDSCHVGREGTVGRGHRPTAEDRMGARRGGNLVFFADVQQRIGGQVLFGGDQRLDCEAADAGALGQEVEGRARHGKELARDHGRVVGGQVNGLHGNDVRAGKNIRDRPVDAAGDVAQNGLAAGDVGGVVDVGQRVKDVPDRHLRIHGLACDEVGGPAADGR